jgi:hypothetical protein
MQQKQSSQYVIGFSFEKSAEHRYRQCFLFGKMYTIFSAVQRQQRKSDVMSSFGLTACSAVYYQVPHCSITLLKSFLHRRLLADRPRLHSAFKVIPFSQIALTVVRGNAPLPRDVFRLLISFDVGPVCVRGGAVINRPGPGTDTAERIQSDPHSVSPRLPGMECMECDIFDAFNNIYLKT